MSVTPPSGSSEYVDSHGALAYSQNRHGLDGAILLDPFFTAHIARLCSEGASVVDIGCGAAPWAIYAAKCGASAVKGYDNSNQMLEQAAKTLVQDTDIKQGLVQVEYGTAQQIPVNNNTFDVALSINVGCALPSKGTAEQTANGTLVSHFKEMRRILKPGGFGIVTAPASLEEVFTTFGDEENKIAELRRTLTEVRNDTDLRTTIGTNEDILRATIVDTSSSFKLADEPGKLEMGRKILRKIPGLVVPNYMHDQAEYTSAIEAAGFEVVSVETPTLSPIQYNIKTGLGSKYTLNNAFDIYLLKKTS